MERTVAFILSTNYAGSHFASLMIGSHSKAAHVGEVCHLRKARTGKAICSRCGSVDKCALFRDIRPDTVARAYDILFGALPATTTLIADNSKKPDWAERFLDHPGFRKKFIHLIRDPRALVRRWDTAYTPAQLRTLRRRWTLREPATFLPLLFAGKRRLMLAKWLVQNQRISRFLRTHGLDHVVVTYRDLALDTAPEMTRIMRFLDLDYEPRQNEYWTVDHHGSQKDGYAWVKSEQRSFIDTRWKEYFDAAEQESIVTDRNVVKYLADLRLRVTPDGLTRNPQDPGAPR